MEEEMTSFHKNTNSSIRFLGLSPDSRHPHKLGLSDDHRPSVQRKPTEALVFPRSGASSHQSAPVNVPVWPKGVTSDRSKFKEDEDDDEMLPPHENVAKSMFEGVGRTLKGRDLRQVRNAIWHKTGFLD
ncbi:hypothetical protein GIB67_001625 [Kingdonia uniflora]|uniref:Senescence regulator n=1 Tax=Kingdonia uniflora TaxID=39325 RepID=A0A7J7L0R8_9MAGN|nr:hypothetical protein GIB67_001625 [Kingdonia uniflora]